MQVELILLSLQPMLSAARIAAPTGPEITRARPGVKLDFLMTFEKTFKKRVRLLSDFLRILRVSMRVLEERAHHGSTDVGTYKIPKTASIARIRRLKPQVAESTACRSFLHLDAEGKDQDNP